MAESRFVGWNMRWFACALLSIFVVFGCSDGEVGDTTPTELATGVAARIEISPYAIILTRPDQTKVLTARVFDADGAEIKSEVRWESTRPEQVAVDADGVVKATGAAGSSQITAHIGTLASPPLLAVHTKVPDDAVLLTDANIVGEPEETSPDAEAKVGNTYTIQLIGVEKPAIGSLLINTEGKIVAGRVTDVKSANDGHSVTLALVPAREMFPELAINEVFDLNQAEVAIPESLLEKYDVQIEGDTYTFTAKPSSTAGGLTQLNVRQQPLEQEFKLGPFTCKLVGDGAAGAGSQVVALTNDLPTFSFTLNNSLDVLFTKAHGLERFVVGAKPTFSVGGGMKVLVAVEAKVTCEVELLVVKLPVGGPIALVIGGQLPIGVGMELSGKLTAANMGISALTTAKTTVDIGLACPEGATCSVVNELGELDLNFAPVVDAPSVGDLRVEPTLSIYAFVKLSIGNPFLKSLRFNAFVVKAGAALKGSFAPQFTQIEDVTYKSDYKLQAEIKAGADTGFIGLAAFMGLNSVAETVAEINKEIGTSPTGTITANVGEFVADDMVNFTVTLDPSKVGFLPLIGPYNVNRILLLRVEPPSQTPKQVASIVAMPGQTEFTIPFVPTGSGKTDEFYAFVVTQLMPVDFFSLELGRVSTSPQVPLNNLRQTIDLPLEISGPTPFTVVAEAADDAGVFRRVAGALVSVEASPECVVMDAVQRLSNDLGVATFSVSPTGRCLEQSFFITTSVPDTTLTVTSPRIRVRIVVPVFEGDLFVDAFALPFAAHLIEVTGDLMITNDPTLSPTAFSMPNLKKVNGRLTIRTPSAFTEVLLPALEVVIGEVHLGTQDNGVSHPEFVRIELPVLQQAGRMDLRGMGPMEMLKIGPVKTTDHFFITRNAFASFDGFSAGIEVGGFLQIVGNSGFSNARALDFASGVTVVDTPLVRDNTGP